MFRKNRIFEYILSLRRFILLAVLIFVFSALYGYFSAQSSPEEIEPVLEELQKIVEPIMAMPLFGQFLFVILNNGLTVFLVIVLGLGFALFPLLVLFSNAVLLGVMAYFFQFFRSWSVFFSGILPHGLIEIPIIIMAAAAGLKLGGISIKKVLRKFRRQPPRLAEEETDLKAELEAALNFFLKFLFPLLILAAAVEIFITSRFL
jgi:stage II sporulation protein M